MHEDLLFLTLETSKTIPNYAKLFMPKLSTTFGMIMIFFQCYDTNITVILKIIRKKKINNQLLK